MKRLLFYFFCITICACNSNSNNTFTPTDEPNKGTINISVDESFKPVINEQLKVYQSAFPKSNIVVHYKSEVECFKDFISDSSRLIIVSRGLTDKENAAYKNNLSFYPKQQQVAYDAVAAIVNINNTDSIFSFKKLQNILSGKEKYTVIVDGNNATSTVKFLQDSVLKQATFGANVVAVNGSDSVIETIKKTTNAIGFVGNSWVNNNYDKQQLENFKYIKLALIECTKCDEKGYYMKASQATLTFGQYPLARSLYCIVKENWLGLGTGFYNFLEGERGQLIFRRSCLVPAKMNFNKRSGNIK